MIKIFFDGACSNNGKPDQSAGIGVVVCKVDNGLVKIMFEYGEYIGNRSNNFAEWYAFIKALMVVQKMQFQDSKFEILGDSMLVIQQFKDNWKIKNESLLSLYQKAKDISNEIVVDFSVDWIERRYNLADKVAKEYSKKIRQER